MKTAESRTLSLASAMASFMWFVWFAITVALQVSTTVSPSIWVSIVGPVGRTLSRKRATLWGVISPPTSFPLLMVLTETGWFAGVVAQFPEPIVPLMKKPKTSLYGVFE